MRSTPYSGPPQPSSQGSQSSQSSLQSATPFHPQSTQLSLSCSLSPAVLPGPYGLCPIQFPLLQTLLSTNAELEQSLAAHGPAGGPAQASGGVEESAGAAEELARVQGEVSTAQEECGSLRHREMELELKLEVLEAKLAGLEGSQADCCAVEDLQAELGEARGLLGMARQHLQPSTPPEVLVAVLGLRALPLDVVAELCEAFRVLRGPRPLLGLREAVEWCWGLDPAQGLAAVEEAWQPHGGQDIGVGAWLDFHEAALTQGTRPAPASPPVAPQGSAGSPDIPELPDAPEGSDRVEPDSVERHRVRVRRELEVLQAHASAQEGAPELDQASEQAAPRSAPGRSRKGGPRAPHAPWSRTSHPLPRHLASQQS